MVEVRTPSAAVGIERAVRRPRVMGVVNVTPDSFSDGGRFAGLEAACGHALALLDAGADILDIGGESTRPGAAPVSEAEELDRVAPVIEAVRAARPDAVVSIDTMKPAVARAAVAAGAAIWNDVNGLRADGALETAAALGVEVVVTHMVGEPRTMQDDPRYGDVVAEVIAFLRDRCRATEAAGVAADSIIADPGVGFGKTLAHNLALMAALGRIRDETGKRVLLGASRKRFIAGVDAGATDPGRRLGGSLAAALWGAQAGVDMVRVHDVAETAQALKVWAAIAEAGDD